MTNGKETSPPASPSRRSPLALTAVALWALALVILGVMRAIHPEKGTVFPTYELAGQHWLLGERIYTVKGGFVYSPLVAAFFAPFSLLPSSLSAILWLLLNAGLFLAAMAWWLRLDLHRVDRASRLQPSTSILQPENRLDLHRIDRSSQAAIYLLLLPLAIGNLHNGQINLVDIALIMFSVLGARTGRWNLSALCIAAATYAKLYPLAAGLLLIVIYPRQLGWRIAAALLLLGGLSLILQKPAYALDQYHQWFATRASDDRHAYDEKMMPRDLWRVLQFLHIPITEKLYWLLRLAAAGALALLCFVAPRRGWALDRLLVATFTLVCCWMLLLGPASESATYVLLAPAVTLALLRAFNAAAPRSTKQICLQWGIAAAYALLLAGLAVNSFTRHNRDPFTMIIQPVGALVFLLFSSIWLFDRSFWAADAKAPASASSL